MCNPDDDDEKDLIVDLVENAVVALPHPIPLLSRELLRANGAGIVCEGLNASDYASTVLGGKAREFLRRGPLDLDTIACHVASSP